MSEAAWRAELGFVDSIWPKIKEAIDGSIFALDTSSPGVEGALKVAADIALTKWREGRATSLPDRETLGEIIALTDDYDGCHARVREWEALEQWERDAHPGEYPSSDYEDAECWNRRADAVLAALSTQPAAGEVEWEYNIAFPETTSEGVVSWNLDGAEPSDSIEIVRDDLASGIYLDSDRIVRRRKAGPWIEVQPEPAPELAELFPGTLAALDRLSIRPEVQS